MLLDFTTLAAGDPVHHTLMVVDVVARGGEYPRTSLVLGNRTGRIESAPFWAGRDDMIRGVAKGMIVQVVGRVTNYRDTRQLEATSVRILPKGSVSLEELVPSAGPPAELWRSVDAARLTITAPRLRQVVDLLFDDDAFRLRYEQCPGAPGAGHHATLGGLLQHTGEVIEIARQIARVARADEELVIAGALVHDIGKVECYGWESGIFETNERGRLIGHVVQGVIMLRQALAACQPAPCTPDEHLLLEHMIVSHHGKLEFGAPVPPATLEAQILHFADDASAKTASITEAYASPELFPEGARVSSKRVWALERWLYRADVTWGREEESQVATVR
jgi:3'-5' exoribonuclease